MCPWTIANMSAALEAHLFWMCSWEMVKTIWNHAHLRYMSRHILKSQERMLYIYSLPQGYFFIRTDLTNLQIPRMVPAGSYMIDIIETAIIVGQRKDMILRVQIEGHIGQRKFQAGWALHWFSGNFIWFLTFTWDDLIRTRKIAEPIENTDQFIYALNQLRRKRLFSGLASKPINVFFPATSK